jgi:toxin HigB-1
MIVGFRDPERRRFGRIDAADVCQMTTKRRRCGNCVFSTTPDALDDLRVPPGNRLEGLKGGRAGQHSIRINDQWRICFVWKDNHAHEVEIVDYH